MYTKIYLKVAHELNIYYEVDKEHNFGTILPAL